MGFVSGIGKVSVLVPNLAEAVCFYCEGLGMCLQSADTEEARIMTPDGVILVLLAGGKEQPDAPVGGITHVCYHTHHVDLTFARALAYGAVRSRPNDPEPYTYENLRMAFVRAPSGEEIEFWSIRNAEGTFGGPIRQNQYIRHFVHVALTVPDMPAAVRFYESIGAVPHADWGWGCSMKLPDGRELELFTEGVFVQAPQHYAGFLFTSEQTEDTRFPITGPSGERFGFEQLMLWPNGPKPLPDLFEARKESDKDE